MTKDFDEQFMILALEEAKKAFDLDEVPIGAIITYQGEIIARAHNQVESLKDATAHAEILCIKQASLQIENWRLSDAVLYSTLEPCPMCAGAMILSRVDTLVWGAPDLRHGAHGSWTDLFSKKHPIHNLKIRQGVLQIQCAELMTAFFRKKRREKDDA